MATIRKSHENAQVQALYASDLDHPMSVRAERLLHTSYAPRRSARAALAQFLDAVDTRNGARTNSACPLLPTEMSSRCLLLHSLAFPLRSGLARNVRTIADCSCGGAVCRARRVGHGDARIRPRHRTRFDCCADRLAPAAPASRSSPRSPFGTLLSLPCVSLLLACCRRYCCCCLFYR